MSTRGGGVKKSKICLLEGGVGVKKSKICPPSVLARPTDNNYAMKKNVIVKYDFLFEGMLNSNFFKGSCSTLLKALIRVFVIGLLLEQNRHACKTDNNIWQNL